MGASRSSSLYENLIFLLKHNRPGMHTKVPMRWKGTFCTCVHGLLVVDMYTWLVMHVCRNKFIAIDIMYGDTTRE